MVDPAGAPAALLLDCGQHPVPAHTLVRIGRRSRAAVTIDAGERTLAENDCIGPPLRQKAAVRTGFTSGTQRAALAALDEPGHCFLVARFVCRICGSLVGVERPLDLDPRVARGNTRRRE